MSNPVRTTAIVDRIEGELAVLEMQFGHQLVVPTLYLPREIHDGAVVAVSFEYDPKATRQKKEDARRLQEDVHSNREPDVI